MVGSQNRRLPAGSQKLRVLIVDDHPVVRAGLALLVNAEPDLVVCGEAADAFEALDLARTHEPEVALVDISLPGRNGLDLVQDLRIRSPQLKCLVVSTHSEAVYGERALRAGAFAYLDKVSASEELVTAIRTVVDGELYMSEWLAQTIGSTLDGARDSVLAALTNRELQVFEMLGHGLGTREVAESLHLSVKTIETYRGRIKAKLNLRTAAEMTRRAVEWVTAAPVREVDASVGERTESRPLAEGERYWICSPLFGEPLCLERGERCLVGRMSGARLRVNSNRISREHAELAWGGAGLTVRDLGSSNGTIVNGYALGSGESAYLEPEDELFVAEFQLLIVVSRHSPGVDADSGTDRFRPGKRSPTPL